MKIGADLYRHLGFTVLEYEESPGLLLGYLTQYRSALDQLIQMAEQCATPPGREQAGGQEISGYGFVSDEDINRILRVAEGTNSADEICRVLAWSAQSAPMVQAVLDAYLITKE